MKHVKEASFSSLQQDSLSVIRSLVTLLHFIE